MLYTLYSQLSTLYYIFYTLLRNMHGHINIYIYIYIHLVSNAMSRKHRTAGSALTKLSLSALSQRGPDQRNPL